MSKPTAKIQLVHVRPVADCEHCSVRRLCLPVSLDRGELEIMEQMIRPHAVLRGGENLYRVGDEFKSLYAIKSGSLKTYGITSDGKVQITGFHYAGELVGMDAIDHRMHACDAVALERCEVCELPFGELEELNRRLPGLQSEFSRAMSREIHSDQHMLMVIGSMNAEQRTACFLLNLYQRMRQRDAQLDGVTLSMTREDIGNYLGLSLETVSRKFAQFQTAGVIDIDKRHIHIRDLAALTRLCR